MLWIAFLFALLIALGALAYVLWPIVSEEIPLLPPEDDRLTDLLSRKDRALRSLKELEFDHQVGKIGDEDYQRFQFQLSRQAVVLIQQVEKIAPATSELDAALEAEIAQLRRVQATTRVPMLSPEIKATNGAAASGTASVAVPESADVKFCTECGTRLEASFKFCASCGAPVAQLVTE